MRWLALILLLIACGPSAEQKARLQKLRDDSIRVAIENRETLKRSLQDSIRFYVQSMAVDESTLLYWKGELEVAKTKLEKIKGFNLLRTEAEKNEQIRNQVSYIDMNEKSISFLTDRIAKSRGRIFDLQLELKKLQ